MLVSRVLLDTNALMDLAVMRDADRHASMSRIIERLAVEGDRPLIPSLALKDVSYLLESGRIMREAIPDAHVRRSAARAFRARVLEECEICAIDELVCRRAQANADEPDYDDALVAECALANGADVIVSSDRAAFNGAVVPKMSPAQCARWLEGAQT